MMATGPLPKEALGSKSMGDELVRRVEAQTARQVQDLQIHCEGSRVTVTGRSRTYYIKQLVTQAIMGCTPSMQLCNEISVY